MSAPTVDRRPGTAALLAAQFAFALRGLWRTRVVLVFSVLLPLVWLLVVGAIAGNATLDESTGLRVMQFVTPTAMAMGVLYAAYPPVAIGLAEARETGVLKRLRGTPLPPWIHLAGRAGGVLVFALASVLASLAVGVAGFGVQIQWRTVPATLVTLVVGIASFAAIGLAAAALSPAQTVAQAASVGTAVALTFVSGMFTVGTAMPTWLETVGDVLPLKPFAELLQDQFNPYHGGSGWHAGRLAVVLAWGAVAALVAVRGFRWEPGVRAGRGTPAAVAARHPVGAARLPVEQRRRSTAGLVLGQARAAARSTRRDPATVFFAIVMPVGLYAFFQATQGQGGEVGGIPFATYFAASMVVWGAAVVLFQTLPEVVVSARERGVLKRLRGTPLRPWQYLAGRTLAGFGLAVVLAVLVLAVGMPLFDVRVPVAGLLAGVPVLALGTVTLAACGFALAAFVPSARAVGAVALVVLLPLAFFSDIFVIGAPEWMRTVGAFFPLRHLQNALVAAWAPGGPTVGWTHLAVLLAWTIGAGAVAVRFFRWEQQSR